MGIIERKEREKEQRRNEIIDAAEKVFFKSGYQNSTIDKVAEVAELSKGTVYLYFEGKEDLYFAIFMRGAQILMKMMQKEIREDRSGLENLVAVGQSFIKFSEKHKNYFSLFMFFQAKEIYQLKIAKKQVEEFIIKESPHTIIYELVLSGVKDGSLRDDIKEKEFATTLWAQMLGIMQVIHSKKEVLEMLEIKNEDILSTHLDLVINGGKRK